MKDSFISTYKWQIITGSCFVVVGLWIIAIGVALRSNPDSRSMPPRGGVVPENSAAGVATPAAPSSATAVASPNPTPQGRVDHETFQRDMQAYLTLLRARNISPSLVTSCSEGAGGRRLNINVVNGWHYQPYQMRLQAAQNLQRLWAQVHSINDPDNARISILDLNGNEVGGSRFWGGTLVWVQEN